MSSFATAAMLTTLWLTARTRGLLTGGRPLPRRARRARGALRGRGPRARLTTRTHPSLGPRAGGMRVGGHAREEAPDVGRRVTGEAVRDGDAAPAGTEDAVEDGL